MLTNFSFSIIILIALLGFGSVAVYFLLKKNLPIDKQEKNSKIGEDFEILE